MCIRDRALSAERDGSAVGEVAQVPGARNHDEPRFPPLQPRWRGVGQEALGDQLAPYVLSRVLPVDAIAARLDGAFGKADLVLVDGFGVVDDDAYVIDAS